MATTDDDTTMGPAQAAAAQVTTTVRHLPGGIVRIEVSGEIDLYNATALTDALRHAAGGQPTRLEIDLSRVTFLGCAGVQALVAARELVATLAVVGAPNPVRRLLTLAGFTAAPPYDGAARSPTARTLRDQCLPRPGRVDAEQ